jgi:hypothetical protein
MMTQPDDISHSEVTDAEYQHNWARRHDSIYRMQLSVLYHRKRERYFDMIERLLQALVTASASGGVALLLAAQNDKGYELWFVAAAAVVSMFQLAYAPAARARQHAQLASDYQSLWSESVAVGEFWSAQMCDSVQSKWLRIGTSSPPQLGALVVDCENELALAYDSKENIRRLPLHMRAFKHLWNWNTTSLKKVLA